MHKLRTLILQTLASLVESRGFAAHRFRLPDTGFGLSTKLPIRSDQLGLADCDTARARRRRIPNARRPRREQMAMTVSASEITRGAHIDAVRRSQPMQVRVIDSTFAEMTMFGIAEFLAMNSSDPGSAIPGGPSQPGYAPGAKWNESRRRCVQFHQAVLPSADASHPLQHRVPPSASRVHTRLFASVKTSMNGAVAIAMRWSPTRRR